MQWEENATEMGCIGEEEDAISSELETHKHDQGQEQARISSEYSGLAVRSLIDQHHREASSGSGESCGLACLTVSQ